MNKDFVSIMDLMPDIFQLAKRELGHFFNTRSYPSKGELFQYDVQVTDEGQKQLLFVDNRYTFARAYADLIGEMDDGQARRTRDDRSQGHMPYVVDLAYDVPEILEIHYLRNSHHIDYITEAYLQVIENMYYHYILAYARSCDPRDRIDQHDYSTDKEMNTIYRYLERGNMIFQLNPDDDSFAATVKKMVCDKSDALSKVKKPTKSDKNKLGYALYPARDLDDLLDYKEFYDTYSRHYGRASARSFEYMAHYMPMLILHVAVSQEKQTFIGSSYPEYDALVKRLPININRNSDTLPSDWSMQDTMDKHLTRAPEDEMYILSYGHGIGVSSSYLDFNKAEYLDGEINKALYTNIYNQIRLMMFGEDDVPVPIDNLPDFEDEVWRNNANLRLSLNASTLEWSEPDERD